VISLKGKVETHESIGRLQRVKPMQDVNGLGGGLTPAKVVLAWSHLSSGQYNQALQGDPKVSPDIGEPWIWDHIFGYVKKPRIQRCHVIPAITAMLANNFGQRCATQESKVLPDAE